MALNPPARQAEPRLGTVAAEFGGTEFDNFERWFDGQNDLPCRAARRTDLAWRTFGRADEAQPQASGRERRRDPRGKTRALLRFIEDMEAAAVKNELERTSGWGGGQKVQGGETATEAATLRFGVGSFDRKRGDIDAKYVEAAHRQPKGIRPRTRADLERQGGLNATRRDELDEQRLWLARIPGKLSRCVALVPGRVRHHSRSLAPNQLPQLASVDGPSAGLETRGASAANGPSIVDVFICPTSASGPGRDGHRPRNRRALRPPVR